MVTNTNGDYSPDEASFNHLRIANPAELDWSFGLQILIFNAAGLQIRQNCVGKPSDKSAELVINNR